MLSQVLVPWDRSLHYALTEPDYELFQLLLAVMQTSTFLTVKDKLR